MDQKSNFDESIIIKYDDDNEDDTLRDPTKMLISGGSLENPILVPLL